MATISENLQAVRARIERAARAAGRDPAHIRLVAVSKTWPAEMVREAAAAGQRAFGESYLQEALKKMDALADLPLEWHFIGPLQSNKTTPVAERFDWVHAVDRLKVAQRLSAARPAGRPPLMICIQVNVSGEVSKRGVAPDGAAVLARQAARLRGLKMRGLMAIPEPTDDVAIQHARFRQLRRLGDELNEAGVGLDTLSMGMSEDLEAAIAEGATIVRVGTAIFGERRGPRHP